jgi:carbamate kinase
VAEGGAIARAPDIVELPVIRRLVADGVLVVAAGGGGVPVVREPTGALRGRGRG